MKIELPNDEFVTALREALGNVALPNGHSGLTSETAQAVHDLKSELRSLASPWLTRKEAAAYAKCSGSHIDHLAQAGQIKRYAGPRFRKEDIDKCIEGGRFLQRTKQTA